MNVNLRFSVFILIFCVATAAAWSVQHDITTINVEVPVRVFEGNKFVPNLAIADFELYENGVRQDIRAGPRNHAPASKSVPAQPGAGGGVSRLAQRNFRRRRLPLIHRMSMGFGPLSNWIIDGLRV